SAPQQGSPANGEGSFMEIPQWLPVVAVVAASIAMIGGMIDLFWQLHRAGRIFGPNSTRALGTVMFIPTLLILAIVTRFETSTLAALLGTVAGYVLSSVTPEDKGGRKRRNEPGVESRSDEAEPS